MTHAIRGRTIRACSSSHVRMVSVRSALDKHAPLENQSDDRGVAQGVRDSLPAAAGSQRDEQGEPGCLAEGAIGEVQESRRSNERRSGSARHRRRVSISEPRMNLTRFGSGFLPRMSHTLKKIPIRTARARRWPHGPRLAGSRGFPPTPRADRRRPAPLPRCPHAPPGAGLTMPRPRAAGRLRGGVFPKSC